MTAVNPRRSALYYPFPFVLDDSWLKSSLLFWDHLYCIRPHNLHAIRLGDKQRFTESEFTRKIKDRVDFLRDIHPTDREDYDGEFTTSAAAGLAELMTQHPQMFSVVPSRGDDRYFAWEGHEFHKTDGHIRQLLSRLGAFGPAGTFREMPGRVYMALLAKRISEYFGLPAVTDAQAHDQILRDSAIFSDLDHGYRFPRSLVLGADQERLKRGMGHHHDSFALCVLTFEGVGVANLSQIPDSTLFAIREKCSVERTAFHDEIQKVIGECTADVVENEEAWRAFLLEKAQMFNRARQAYDDSLRALGVQTAVNLLRASCSIPIADLISKYMTLSTPVAIGAATIAGVTSVAAVLHKTAFERAKERRFSPSAFYLSEIRKAAN